MKDKLILLLRGKNNYLRKEDHHVDFFHAIKAGPKIVFNWSIHLVASLLHEFNFLISVMDYDFVQY